MLVVVVVAVVGGGLRRRMIRGIRGWAGIIPMRRKGSWGWCRLAGVVVGVGRGMR